MDTASLKLVRLPEGMQAHRLAASGSQVVFDEIGYGGDAGQGRSIHLAELASGTTRVIGTAAGADAAWVPDIDGHVVAWTEWHYPVLNGGGELTWHVISLDLNSGLKSTVASGMNRRLEGPAAIPPLVQVSGDRIAYTIEDPTPDRPFGWKIEIRSLTTGALEREYSTDESIYQMALSGSNVLYSEGLVDQDLNFKYHTRLMLATPSSSRPLHVADDAFEVALDSSRFAWVADVASSQGQVGLAQHPRVMTATIDDPTPVAISIDAGPQVRGSVWPSTADGRVVWSDDEQVGPETLPGNYLATWTPDRPASVLKGVLTIVPLLGGSGWISWYDDSASGINAVIRGGELAKLLPAGPTP